VSGALLVIEKYAAADDEDCEKRLEDRGDST